MGGVRGRACRAAGVCRSLQWLQRQRGHRLGHLPNQLRPQQVLGHGRPPHAARRMGTPSAPPARPFRSGPEPVLGPAKPNPGAERIVVHVDGAVVAEHARSFGRDRTLYDPWRYLPVLARKPGALRNGAPFVDWELPPALTQLRRRLGSGDEADRRFVRVLCRRSGEPSGGIDPPGQSRASGFSARPA